jgi:hypothetical protein
MLRLLTDEHISPAGARQAPTRCRGLRVVAMREWENGHFLGATDQVVLQEAHEQKLTLVTFDLRTIPPLLRHWAEQGVDHGGVILVHERTLPQNDVGGLVNALCALWRAQGGSDWTNRVIFLKSEG